jgi:ComF family protein
LLHNIKYRQREDLAIALGRQLGRELKAAKWEVDTILPVPLHPRKQRQRGYNQSELLCDGMGEAMGIPVWPNALQRLRHTESQTAKNTTERLLNVKDAFAVAPRFKETLRGRHLLLVDDVLTTGATLESCALTLLQAVPNIKISIATLAVVSS